MNNNNKSDLKNKKVFIAIHPKEPIMISVGEDKTIYLWDIEQNNILFKKNLDVIPTCCRFSPDGDLLVIGFVDGVFIIYDSKI